MPTTAKKKSRFKIPTIRSWLKALRTERWPQTDGTLFTLDAKGSVDSCCCLGVAACLTNRKVKEGENGYHSIFFPKSMGGFIGTGDLPNSLIYEMLIKAGHKVSVSESEGFVDSLAAMNDSGRWTFPQIADAIEYAVAQRATSVDVALNAYVEKRGKK